MKKLLIFFKTLLIVALLVSCAADGTRITTLSTVDVSPIENKFSLFRIEDNFRTRLIQQLNKTGRFLAKPSQLDKHILKEDDFSAYQGKYIITGEIEHVSGELNTTYSLPFMLYLIRYHTKIRCTLKFYNRENKALLYIQQFECTHSEWLDYQLFGLDIHDPDLQLQVGKKQQLLTECIISLNEAIIEYINGKLS